MNTTQIQQGDILLEKVATLPVGSKLVKRTQHGVILAESPVTNNRHFLPSRDVQLFEAPDKKRYVVNEGTAGADLVHSQDHGTITVAPGVHRVNEVQEMDHLTGMQAPVVD